MSERDLDRRNRRIWAAIFTCIAVGFVGFGFVHGDWRIIALNVVAAIANLVGALYMLKRPESK